VKYYYLVLNIRIVCMNKIGRLVAIYSGFMTHYLVRLSLIRELLGFHTSGIRN
jgi:hypothetical protein